MAEDSTDGIDEAFEGTLRMALTSAARLGEQFARVREREAREAQQHSEHRAHEMALRLKAEQETARASLAAVYRPDWWASAGPEEIASMYQTTRAWIDIDPEAARAERRIAEEVQQRYNVDLTSHEATDPRTLKAELHKAEEARGADQKGRATDASEGAVLLSAAELDAQAQADADAATHDRAMYDLGDGNYDSLERRAALAAKLEGRAEPETIVARVLSDTAQARPVQEATRASAPTRTGVRAAGTRQGRAAQRDGLSR